MNRSFARVPDTKQTRAPHDPQSASHGKDHHDLKHRPEHSKHSDVHEEEIILKEPSRSQERPQYEPRYEIPRNNNGRLIVTRNTHLSNLCPTVNLCSMDARSVCKERREEIFCEEEKYIKSPKSIEERQKQRKGRGYKCYRYSLAAPICPETCFVEIPKCGVPLEAVHVEDMIMEPGEFVFNCDTNGISFSEGVIISDCCVKTTFGETVILPRNFNSITETLLLFPSGTLFRQIRVRIDNHNLKTRQTVYLLESQFFKPSDSLNGWPFYVEEVVDSDYVICTPFRNYKSLVLISTTFEPEILVILPYLDPHDLCAMFNRYLVKFTVSWDRENCDKECFAQFKVVSNCNPKSVSYQPVLFHGQVQFFCTRISPRNYCDARTLTHQLEFCLNPAIVTFFDCNITINDVTLAVAVGEYLDDELSEELELTINNFFNWTGVNRLSVVYCNGIYKFSKMDEFSISFGPNSISETIGFNRDKVLYGRNNYCSDFCVFHPTSDRCKTQINRYVANYDCVKDSICVSNVSRADWLSQKIPGFTEDEFPNSNSFSVPFRFDNCDSFVTNYLGFEKKQCEKNKEEGCLEARARFVQSCSKCEVSKLLHPPITLYVIIPELEATINIASCQITSCNAVLYFDGRVYRIQRVCENELLKDKNIRVDHLDRLTIQIFTPEKVCYPCGKGNINFRMTV